MTFFQNRNVSSLEEHDHINVKKEEQVSRLNNVELPSPNIVPPSPSREFVSSDITVMQQPVRQLQLAAQQRLGQPSASHVSPWRHRVQQASSVVPGGKHQDALQVYTVAWDDERTLCLIVGMGNGSVARRCDNDMINGTKLLNATGMSRGRRDGILKAETDRKVTKVGPAHLKGVWIPYQRALEIATREGIKRQLYPLFEKDIGSFLYHKNNLMRTQQVVRAAQRRHPGFEAWIHGIPKALTGFEKPSPSHLAPQNTESPRKNYDTMVTTDSSPAMNILPGTPDPPSRSPMGSERNIEQENYISWHSASPLDASRAQGRRESIASHHTASSFPLSDLHHRDQDLLDNSPPSLNHHSSHESATNEEYDQLITSVEFQSIIDDVDKWWYTDFN